MDDDIVALKVLVVSDRGPEREALRRAASLAALPLFVTELDSARGPGAVCDWLARESPDIVVIDMRMASADRAAMIEAARAASGDPLLIAMACNEGKVHDALAEGLSVDGMITSPVDAARAQTLLSGCVRARTGSRVLVVDDSSTVRAVVRKVLQASRFRLEAHEAGNAAAAVDRALDEPFDIVFLDCHMPGRDGFSTVEELRRIRPGIKVVMMTATNDPLIRVKVREAGGDDLLLKPFYAKDIDAILNRLFGLVTQDVPAALDTTMPGWS